MPISVKLTCPELMVAGQVGLMRRVSSIKEGYDKNKHADISNWATDIDGACAEMAVAKWLGAYWSGHVRSFKDPDIGPFQVRASSHKRAHLILRPNDSPEETYLLVTVDDAVCTIVGHLLGKEGMVDPFWRPNNGRGAGAWWVPQDFETLVKL